MDRPALRTAVISLAAIGLTAIGGPASAQHAHIIDTPGTCVDRAGVGFGAGEDHTAPSFHSQVHKGTPGLFAFERPNNRVEVIGFLPAGSPIVCP